MKDVRIRPMDANGRIVIPDEFMKACGIQRDDFVSVYMEGNKIIIEKSNVKCPYCGSTENILCLDYQDERFIVKEIIENSFFAPIKCNPNEHYICESCLQKFKDM